MADSDCYDEPVGRLFIVKDDDTDGSAFPVFDGEIMIGRATDCEIRIRKPMVSKRHALLSVEGDQVYIHNFSKHNRTAVNKRLVTTSRRLKHQDKIYIHDRVFRFEYAPELINAKSPGLSGKSVQWPGSVEGGDETQVLDASLVQSVLGDSTNAGASATKKKQPPASAMETVVEETAAPAGMPTPLRREIQARRKSTGGKAKQGKGLPTPIRAQINARRQSAGSSMAAVEAPAESAEKAIAALPTPLRKAIQARRKSTGGKQPAAKGLPTPLRADIQARRISFGSTAPHSAAKSTPGRAAVSAGRAALPTPLRTAINARRQSMSTPEAQPASAGRQVSLTPAKDGEEKLSVTFTAASPEVKAAAMAALPTPIRFAINSRRKSYGSVSQSPAAPGSEAGVESEEEDVCLEAEAEQAHSALPTPLRAAINARRVSAATRRSSVGTVGAATPGTTVTSHAAPSTGKSKYAAAAAMFDHADAEAAAAEEDAAAEVAFAGARALLMTPGTVKSRRESAVSVPASVYAYAAELMTEGEDAWLGDVVETETVETQHGNVHLFFDMNGEILKSLVEPLEAGKAGDVQPALHTVFDADGNEVATRAVYEDDFALPAEADDAALEAEEEEAEEADGEYLAEGDDVADEWGADAEEEWVAASEEGDVEFKSRYAARRSMGLGDGEGRPNQRMTFSTAAEVLSSTTPGSVRSRKSRRTSTSSTPGQPAGATALASPSPAFIDAVEAADEAFAAASAVSSRHSMGSTTSQGSVKRPRSSMGSAPGTAEKAAPAVEADAGEWEAELRAAEEGVDEDDAQAEAATLDATSEQTLGPAVAVDDAADIEAGAEEDAVLEESETRVGDDAFEAGELAEEEEEEDYFGRQEFNPTLATVVEADNEDGTTIGTRTPGSALRKSRRSSATFSVTVPTFQEEAASDCDAAEDAEPAAELSPVPDTVSAEHSAEAEADDEATDEAEEADVDFAAMKVAELRAECEARGLDSKGRKAELIERLESAAGGEGVEADDEAEDVDFASMSYTELQAACKEAGLPATGKKAALIARLQKS